MSPLPFWLVGAQSVVLNMSNNDQPLHLHYALFNGTQGYRLKPPEMMRPVLSKADASFRDHEEVRTSGGTDLRRSASTSSVQCRHSASTRQSDYRRSEVSHAESATDGADETRRQSNDEDYWPPPRDRLHRCTLEIISLHNLPKCREQRPRFDGSRSACHLYVPELSGAAAPPDGAAAVSSSLKLHFSVHPIGGAPHCPCVRLERWTVEMVPTNRASVCPFCTAHFGRLLRDQQDTAVAARDRD
jgi:hypothetical protein